MSRENSTSSVSAGNASNNYASMYTNISNLIQEGLIPKQSVNLKELAKSLGITNNLSITPDERPEITRIYSGYKDMYNLINTNVIDDTIVDLKKIATCKGIDNSGFKITLLHEAARQKNLRVFKSLLKYIPIKSKNGQNVVFYVIFRDSDKKFLDSMVSLGADLNTNTNTDEYKNTPLHGSIANEAFDIAHVLINLAVKHKFTLNTRDIQYKTPLHLACMVGEEDVVEHLIKSGAALNLRDQAGRTALHYAVLRGIPTTVRRLIEAGASISIRDYDKLLPIDMASEKKEILDLLKKVLDELCIDKNRHYNTLGSDLSPSSMRAVRPQDSVWQHALNGRKTAILLLQRKLHGNPMPTNWVQRMEAPIPSPASKLSRSRHCS